MKTIMLLLFAGCIAFGAAAQDKSLYGKHWFIQNGDTLPYRILLPEGYDAAKKYPLVIFLHGRGESGNDNEKQLSNGAALFLSDSNRKRHPAIVVFPQCAANSYWSNVHTVTEGSKGGKRTFYFVPDGPPSGSMTLLLGLVDHLMVRYPVQKSRVYAMGLSMGGMGTYELVRRKPGTFAAAVAICGGAHPATAKDIKNTGWWVFHGAKDDVVPPEHSQIIVAALKAQKATVRFTLYPDANHNSWDPAFKEKELLPWLFSQKKK